MSIVASPELYINRELSWLAFNQRVLAQAQDPTLPLFERLKFLGIFTSNLDEFFMVRVAGLKQQILGGVRDVPADGMLPSEQLAAISSKTHELVAEQYRVWREEVAPALEAQGFFVNLGSGLNSEQADAARDYFENTVFSTLTPLAIDSGHPFPHLRNRFLNLAFFLEADEPHGSTDADGHELLLAVVQIPTAKYIPRLVPLPTQKGKTFILLEDLVALHADELFPGYSVKEIKAFRLTRNWDLSIDEEESEDLLSSVKAELRRRDRGAAVRLEIDSGASSELKATLMDTLRLTEGDSYDIDGPLQIYDLAEMKDFEGGLDHTFEPFRPVIPHVIRKSSNIFHAIQRHDILLHHPYQSFHPVVRFVEEAAEDPSVIAIKQTFYRTSGDSPFIRALSRAAENGKQVTAFVEIKARFDEENNIAWARQLEDSGVHVAYGFPGIKTHAKATMVVRKEDDRIRRYVHLGTGNYNPTTARLYTDLSYLTCREAFTADVAMFFNRLTGYSVSPDWRILTVAPNGLQERILSLIAEQAELARAGEPSRIQAKMNSLVDPITINALYEASQAGVPIDLSVRGICCLRPGLAGVSENIRVISIVDRFLEHSRVFAFGVGADIQVFLSSADWMPRNFLRRIEIMFPILDADLQKIILNEVFDCNFRDNVKAWQGLEDGSYEPVRQGSEPPLRCQYHLMEHARHEREAQVGTVTDQPVMVRSES